MRGCPYHFPPAGLQKSAPIGGYIYMVWQLQGGRRPQAARPQGGPANGVRRDGGAIGPAAGPAPCRGPQKSSPRWDCGYLGVVRAAFRAAKVHSGRWMAREASGSRASGRWASLQVRIWYRSA